MATLESYVAGKWIVPDDTTVPLYDAASGAEVKAGDSLTVTLTAKQLTPRLTADYGEVCWDAVVTNQNDEPVATYDVLTLVAKRPADAKEC